MTFFINHQNNGEQAKIYQKGEMKNIGKFTYSNGDTYYGTTKNNKRNGYGIYQKFKGGKYEGEWKNDDLNGYAIEEKEEDNEEKTKKKIELLYFGNWKDGKKEGYGLNFDKNNNCFYIGKWSENQRNGEGFQKQKNYYYFGDFKKDMFNGYGFKISQQGEVYEGLFKDNEEEGFGVMYFSSQGIPISPLEISNEEIQIILNLVNKFFEIWKNSEIKLYLNDIENF